MLVGRIPLGFWCVKGATVRVNWIFQGILLGSIHSWLSEPIIVALLDKLINPLFVGAEEEDTLLKQLRAFSLYQLFPGQISLVD
uniref:Uncharacterized protein n=1 Tax=Rhizophora mucronata TaxID=61149 RepID=A0A2P2IHY6_RHIMU